MCCCVPSSASTCSLVEAGKVSHVSYFHCIKHPKNIE